MRRRLRTLLTTLTFAASAPAVFAQEGPVVVELYTSQGCSSCPPADAMLAELSGRDDVIPLALHVDYWDYIGWKDEFARPEHTARQQAYARAAGATTIYTPQFVIAGRDVVVGAKAMKLADLIRARSMEVMPVNVVLERSGETLSIAASARDDVGVTGEMIVQIVRVTGAHSVDIRRGENAGKAITYTNIVQSWDVVGRWDGQAPLAITAEVAPADMVAVVVQAGANGPVMGAARVD